MELEVVILSFETGIGALGLKFGFGGRILGFEARIWVRRPYEEEFGLKQGGVRSKTSDLR